MNSRKAAWESIYKSLHHAVFCDKISPSGLISELLRNIGMHRKRVQKL